MSTPTHTQCFFCLSWTENNKHYCSNSSCSLAEKNWNGYLPQLQNSLTGQIANLSEFGKLRKAFAMGFTKIGPVPATPAPRPVPPPTPAYVVVGYAPVHPVIIIRR